MMIELFASGLNFIPRYYYVPTCSIFMYVWGSTIGSRYTKLVSLINDWNYRYTIFPMLGNNHRVLLPSAIYYF
jgi:hypothetical protein